MTLLRSRSFPMFIAIGIGCMLIPRAPAGAQTFFEVGGGWNYVAPVDSRESSHGANLRASIGWQVAPNFRWRIDAFQSQFDAKSPIVAPCPYFGCAASYSMEPERVSGLTVNGLWGVEPRGVLYVVGGAGLYHVQLGTSEQWPLGVSAGAGLALPLAARVSAVVEARWHGMFGVTAGPTWLVPITFGVRVF